MKKRTITIGVDASRAFVKDPAGPEYYSWHLLRSLAKIDRKNRYILYLRPKQRPNFPLPQNFKTKTVYPNHFWTQAGLAWETLAKPPDVLFIPAHTLPLITRAVFGIGSKAGLLPQLPILVTVHGLEGKYLPQSESFLSHIHRNWSISWSIRFANHLIAVSNNTLKDVLNTYNIDHKRIEVVHEGVDFEKYHNAQVGHLRISKKYHFSENYILFVGTLQPRKNLVRLIEAYSKVKHDGQLVIAGKPGWLYDDIMQAPRRFGIEGSVVFTGRIKDSELSGLYKGAQAFVLPSLTEGFGLPVLEAQAAGIPVVCSDRGALREVAGDAAIFINPQNIPEITRAITRVLEDKILRSDLVKKGVKNARDKSWTHSAYSTLKIIRGLAG